MLHEVIPCGLPSYLKYDSRMPIKANCELSESSDGKLHARAKDLVSELLIRSGSVFRA